MTILAIDVGTSSVKAAVLDQKSGDPVGGHVAKVEYHLDHPTPDAAEVTADALWAAVSAAAQKAVRDGGAGELEGVGLSCLTPAVVLLDSNGEVLAPIRIHLDRRSRPAARRVQAEAGAEFLATVGNPPLPGGISAVSYAQMAADDPTLAGRVAAYLHPNAWLGYRLTGAKCIDPGNASFSGLYGTLTDQKWSPRWCDYFGVKREWLPEIVDGRATIGGLSAAVAKEWGVADGLPVKLGVADTSSAMLAAKLQVGDLLHVVGTTQVLAVMTPKPVASPRRLTRRLGAGPEFVAVAHNPVGGAALDWVYQLCFSDRDEAAFFADTIPAAATRKTSVKLDPRFLGGDRMQVEPQDAAFTHLTLSAKREDLLAALIDGMRAGHREALAAVSEVAELTGRVVLTGGGATAVAAVLPEYQGVRLDRLSEGSLRGVARLFD